MKDYQKLKEYIDKSEVRRFNNRMIIRLSNELAETYDKGEYKEYLEINSKHIELLDSLNLKYPSTKIRNFYFYIVPDDNYAEILNVPEYFAKKSNGGGRPVESFDSDSYARAYGISQNIALYKHAKLSTMVNQIHELAHLVTLEFKLKHAFICEGIAEVIPLYIFDMENEFDDHRELLTTITENEIYTISELLSFDKTGLGGRPLLPNRSCSFEQGYASSYLVIRGIIDIIMEKFELSKIEALQLFLDICEKSELYGVNFIKKVAEALNIDSNELLNLKTIQLQVIKDLGKVKKI